MQESRFRQHMRAYDRWRAGLVETIERFQAWLDEQGLGSGENDLRIFEALDTLRSDQLNIAFVAEFSRGKTELINAIFFADQQRRLLPSEAGRTTMCPTELFYDRDMDQAYIRLLPIETRLEEPSIAEYKREPIHWTTIPLDTSSPEQMGEALREVVKVKRVTRDEAVRLGMIEAEEHLESHHIDIPMWRHALISYPHPLLKQGLVVLDTPGLNALGNEPELTLNMLPGAQGVVFVLAADSGVTRSDMELWQHYIQATQRQGTRGLVAVLNKIDVLWDDLRDAQAVESSIDNQCGQTAQVLGIERSNVFPVSAQKGLLGKIRNDGATLGRSRLTELENYLSEELLPAKQSIVRDDVVADVGGILDNAYQMLEERRQAAENQLEELRGLSGKNADVIVHLMRKSREEQATYLKHVESFQSSRRLMSQQGKALLASLSLDEVDKLTARTRKTMVESWTTAGLKRAMAQYFDGARQLMEQASTQADQTQRLVQAIYRKFHRELGFRETTPRSFDTDKYAQELEALYRDAEAFRNSPVTTMTEQSYVIKKFFVSLVSHARNVFSKAHHDAETWLKEALAPLAQQIKEHKHQMEKRLETLRKINQSRETLDSKIAELESELEQVTQQLETLEGLRKDLEHPMPFEVVASETDDTDSRAAL